ncbi:MAG: hypothetical protein WBA53_08605 [Burkholderiaceae bacterium]
MTMNASPAPVGKASLTGRVALLLAAFACAVAASLAAGLASLVLVVAAFALAGAAFVRPVAIRLGAMLKPATRGSALGAR